MIKYLKIHLLLFLALVTQNAFAENDGQQSHAAPKGQALLDTKGCSALPEHTVSLEEAKVIVNKAEALSSQKGWSMAIAIVDASGQLVLFERQDDTQVGSLDLAIQKAKSANAFRRPTKAFEDSIRDGKVGLLTSPGVVAVAGGIPLIRNGKVIGAIGVSGAHADEDAQVAQEGASHLPQKMCEQGH